MTITDNIKLFGNRVLFKPIEQELTGTIVLPQNRQKQYELGEVIKVGDGKVKTAGTVEKIIPMLVKPGDLVWFQVNPCMVHNNAVRLDGKTFMTVVQHDLIATLKTAEVTIDNIEMLGTWVLLDTFEDKITDSLIVVPDTANNPRGLRYTVKKKGCLANEIAIGDEVIIEKNSANLVTINNEPFFYIDCKAICGVIAAAK